MSKAKIYIYIITILWSFIVALLGPALFAGSINPAHSSNEIARLFYINYFFITTYIIKPHDSFNEFIYNMLSALIIGLLLSLIITRIAVEKKYKNKSPDKEPFPQE